MSGEGRSGKSNGSNGRLAVKLVAVVALMVGASFVAVPFYSWFCRVTGFAGTTQVATTGSETILDREITVRFDANVGPGMPWKFQPLERTMKVRIGETALAFYEAWNPTDKPTAGTAAYNVAPDSAGYYFSKIQCFCFTEQVLAPGERVLMPVSFYVDPEIVNDRDAKSVTHITLSYTFYPQELPDDRQASAAPAVKDTNTN